MSDALYETVAKALRRSYDWDYCPSCGKYDPDDDEHSDDCDFARAFGALATLAAREPEPREGMAMVYDWHGRYIGCIGVERWREQLAEAERDIAARGRAELPCPVCGDYCGDAATCETHRRGRP
ncbi:MAG: hypothetical protein NUW01_01700 [Gemmatimonadaceae bacterium]|nr:hypothetical protein [Gemmatimonadaceae bacterium]